MTIVDHHGLDDEVRDEVRGLREAVDRLAAVVDALVERIEPIEEHVTSEQREARRRQWAIDQGWTPPDDPATGVHLAPSARGAWLRSVTDAAATTGGGRILAGVVAVVLAITAPELLAVVTPLVGMVPPTVVEGVEGDATALPDGREPLDDSPPPLGEPAAPRPVL